jgi:hypothetical protein
MLESIILKKLAQPEALLAFATSGHRELLHREGTTRALPGGANAPAYRVWPR